MGGKCGQRARRRANHMPVARTLVVITVAILCSTPPLLAQKVAVGRVSYSEGSVSLQPGGRGEWTKVDPGTTVTAADIVWADQNSRAELLLADDIIRIDSETSLAIESASEDSVALKLWLGSIIVTNGGKASRTIKIETPNLLFAFQEPGEYRLDVNAPGDVTVATVWEGKGEATGGGARYFVQAGQRAKLSGTADLQILLGAPLPADDFDQWATNRDPSLPSGQSRRAAANDTTRPTEPDQSGSPRNEADDRELGPDGPGTVAIRCPTPWCEVVEAYPVPWIWPPWWGPYPDPWVLTASWPQPSPQAGGVTMAAGQRPMASETPRRDVARSPLLSPPRSSQAVPASPRTAGRESSQPSNPKRSPGSTDGKSHSQPTSSRQRDLGSASSGPPSTTTAGETKTTRH
jgi:hypothetical protein